MTFNRDFPSGDVQMPDGTRLSIAAWHNVHQNAPMLPRGLCLQVAWRKRDDERVRMLLEFLMEHGATVARVDAK